MGQDRSSSLRCGRSVLTHRPLLNAAQMEAENDKPAGLTTPVPSGMTAPDEVLLPVFVDDGTGTAPISALPTTKLLMQSIA